MRWTCLDLSVTTQLMEKYIKEYEECALLSMVKQFRETNISTPRIYFRRRTTGHSHECLMWFFCIPKWRRKKIREKQGEGTMRYTFEWCSSSSLYYMPISIGKRREKNYRKMSLNSPYLVASFMWKYIRQAGTRTTRLSVRNSLISNK